MFERLERCTATTQSDSQVERRLGDLQHGGAFLPALFLSSAAKNVHSVITTLAVATSVCIKAGHNCVTGVCHMNMFMNVGDLGSPRLSAFSCS